MKKAICIVPDYCKILDKTLSFLYVYGKKKNYKLLDDVAFTFIT